LKVVVRIRGKNMSNIAAAAASASASSATIGMISFLTNKTPLKAMLSSPEVTPLQFFAKEKG